MPVVEQVLRLGRIQQFNSQSAVKQGALFSEAITSIYINMRMLVATQCYGGRVQKSSCV